MNSRTSEKPRGTCPVCHRHIVMLKDGRIGRHGSHEIVWPPDFCKGWGQLAVERKSLLQKTHNEDAS